MKKHIYILAGAVVIFLAGVIYISIYKGQESPKVENKPVVDVSTVYSMSEIADHNSRESCWTAVNGSAYDLTDWIDSHPGGQAAILNLCGTDSTAVFSDQHGGQPRPEEELASHKIGVLAEQ